MAAGPTQLQLALRTLGHTALLAEATTEEERSLLPTGKPLALFTFLACTPNRTATRDQLLDLLWSDVGRESARHTLRQTLWYIKRRLGDDPFTSRGDTLTLTAAVTSDRDAFLAALDAGDLEAAVERYTGDFFPDFAAAGGVEFEHWADKERDRLRGLFIRASEALVRARIGEWRARDAVPLARRARALASESQTTWRLVLDALLAADDRVSALSEAEQLEQWLAREELPAESATTTLLRKLRSESGPPIPAPTEEALTSELVGRERELALLMDAWTSARRGRAAHVHITARAGLGKSRLLDGLAKRLRATKARLVCVRALQANRELPFALAADLTLAMARLRGAAGVSPDVASALVALAPGVSTYLSAQPDRATGDDALRRRALAVQELVATIADDAPVAILLDDLHWGDASSRTLVASLAASLASTSVLLVTASREADALFGTESRMQPVSLAPLSVDEIGTLLRSLGELGDATTHAETSVDWAQTLPSRLHAAASGSPLLTLEMLQLALERGALRLAERRWSCPDPVGLTDVLQSNSAMRDRLLAVGEAHQGTLLLFAVIGTELNAAAVERAAGADGTTALQELETRGLLAQRNGAWMIAHDEIAELTRELASATRLARAHRQAASVLEADAHDAVNLLLRAAQHRYAAGDHADVSRLLARIARLTDAVGDRAALGALAQSVLGADGTRAQRDALLASLPWRTRTQLRRLIGTTAGATALLITAAALWQRSGAIAARPDALLFLPLITAEDSTLLRVELRDDQLRRAEVLNASAERVPMTALRALARMTRTYLGPGDTVVGTTYEYGSEAGGELQSVPLRGGAPSRLTNAPGDAYGATAGPEPHLLLFQSARWDSLQRADVALLDRRTLAVRALTRTPDVERSAMLSPDGSRVVFLRVYAAMRPSTVCWISIDGRVEKCLPPNTERGRLLPIGWYDAEQVLVTSETDEDARLSLARLHLGTGGIVPLDEGADGYDVSPSGRFVLATYRADGARAAALEVFSTDRPSRHVPIRWRGAAIPFRHGTQLWREDDLQAERIADVRIWGVPREVPADAQVQLSLSAQTQRGVSVEVPAIWWQSLDTTRAQVREDGLLIARVPGDVQIVASAGGWRADTTTVRVTPPRLEEPVLDERWASLDTLRWLTTGTPVPYVQDGALHVNGDHHLPSGLVSWRAIDPEAGIGLELRMQLPMTEVQWQSLTVGFAPMGTDPELRAWTGRAGPYEQGLTDRSSADRQCYLAIPRGEGGDEARQLAVTNGRHVTSVRDAPVMATDGAWHTVRLQLFRDGRCGVAIDGQVLALSRRAIPMDFPMRVIINGQSMFTTVRVGALSVWRGERHDVRWYAGDGSASAQRDQSARR